MNKNYHAEKGDDQPIGVPTWEVLYEENDGQGDTLPVLICTCYDKWTAEHIAELLNEDGPV